MKPRVAVWCPQGRAKLPLAAALCREQLPEKLIVWSSDEAAPAEPAAVTADLWLVFCVGDPPQPPDWRSNVAGPWAVFPGTAAAWTEATRAAAGVWRPDCLLSDLLPDETENPVWHAWWRAADFVWLPIRIQNLGSADRPAAIGVLVGKSFPSWLADSLRVALPSALGEPIDWRDDVLDDPGAFESTPFAPTRRVVLAGTDPLETGLGLEWASRGGGEAFFLGTPPPALRCRIVDPAAVATAAYPLELESRMGPRLRQLMRELARSPRRRAPTPAPDWRGWLEEVVGKARVDTSLETEALRHLRTVHERPDWPDWEAAWATIRGEMCVDPDVGCLGAGGAWESMIQWIEQAPQDGGIFRLIELLVKLNPEALTALGRLAGAAKAGNTGRAILLGVSDVHVFGDRRAAVVVAEEILRSACRRVGAPAEWTMWHAVTLALLGRLDAADELLARLLAGHTPMAAWALGAILRGWLPAIAWAETAILPAAGRNWWKGHVMRCGESAGDVGWLLGAWGLAAFGDADAAEECWARAVSATAAARAQTAVAVGLFDGESRARRWWAPHDHEPLAGNAGERFIYAVARLLLGDGNAAEWAALMRIDAEAPELFSRGYPSHLRCFLRALAHRRHGQVTDAERWYARARAESPLAAGLHAAWERALPIEQASGIRLSQCSS